MIKKTLTTISLKETAGIDRINEPISVGIPFPKGLLYETPALALQDSEGNYLPLQTQVLAVWSDSSLKWVLLDFQGSVKADRNEEMALSLDETASDKPEDTYIIQNQNEFIIDTKTAVFSVNSGIFRPFDRAVVNEKEVLAPHKSKTVLTDESGIQYEPVISDIFLETKGPVRTTLRAEGDFISPEKSVFASFFSRIHFFTQSATVRIEFTILNPKAAKHPGGLWDIGDSGSIFFNDLSIYTKLNSHKNTDILWTTNNKQQTANNKQPIIIYQDSSGGKNWNSRNHINRNSEVRNTFKGYKVCQGEETIEAGDRATPIISITDDEIRVAAAIQYFWQNFPKAIEAHNKTLTIRLFPKQYNDRFELQGGEQKTHSVFLDFGDFPEIQNIRGTAQAPLIAYAAPEWYAESGAFSYLIPESKDPNEELTELINIAVEGENTFFHRREIIDEYGWRNFGDLYADHESAGHKGPDPLISHYNNQYDCLNSFLTQFARSGDDRWFLLGDQLCSHIKDIDIYHTDQDRPEYNHGLFWHTEHYIAVQTATHRCFSKKHAGQRNLAAYGGGPALSHNYSTGLLTHYYMTGSLSSKAAALGLAEFIISNIEMGNTVLSRTRKQARKAKLSLKHILGKEKLVELTKVYELDGPGRASGNSLSTLINAYILTDDEKYIEKADYLIYNCIHPEDKIEERDLADVENRWMYTVFLQAVGKYLDMKAEKGKFDAMWEYARQSLIHYAKWMIENEYPYLKKPEKLEYPNETWAGQELRKCNVLLYAAKYYGVRGQGLEVRGKGSGVRGEEGLREIFQEKAEYFYQEAVRYLLSYETRTLTRPIALAMQNGMMNSYAKVCGIASVDSPEYNDYNKAGKNRPSFSLTREIQFLKWRLLPDS